MVLKLIIIISCAFWLANSQATDCAEFGKCILCDPQGTPNRACQLCGYGVGLVDGQCIQCQINGCFNCDQLDQCLDCGPGQGVSYDGLTCTPCANQFQCTDCYYSATCLSCNPGFYLVQGVCTQCPAIPDCFACETEDRCSQCNVGVGLNDLAQCEPCQGSSCVDCLVSTICILCQPGYYLKNGRCYSLC